MSVAFYVWLLVCARIARLYNGGEGPIMARARAYGEERLCEECGQPLEKGREGQMLCRRCEDRLERQKRSRRNLRDSRRHSRREEEW